jgi:hypothetical protein
MTVEVDLPPAAEARLRAALDAAAATAPVPAAWDAVRERVETGDTVVPPARRRSPALVAAAAVVLLTLAGVAVLTVRVGGDTVTAAGTEAYCATLDRTALSRISVMVFLDPDAAPTDPAAVEAAIAATGLAADVVRVDRAQAYAEARELFADQPTMLDVLRPEDVPSSFRLTVVDVEAADRIATLLESEPGVLTVEDTRAWRLDVLQVLDRLADPDASDDRSAHPQRVDEAVVAALEDTAPDDVAGELAAVAPLLRSQADAGPGPRAAARALVADAAARCGRAPDPLPGEPAFVLDGDLTTTTMPR